MRGEEFVDESIIMHVDCRYIKMFDDEWILGFYKLQAS